MLLMGCSPFVSTTVKLSPKSQNIWLKWIDENSHLTTVNKNMCTLSQVPFIKAVQLSYIYHTHPLWKVIGNDPRGEGDLKSQEG